MRLALANGDKELLVDLDGFKVDSIEEISKIMTEAGKLFSTYDKHVCHCNNKTIEKESIPPQAQQTPRESQPQQILQEHDFSIRERLPNNVIDLSSLDVKKAETANVLVRCPLCGQSHCVSIMSDGRRYLFRKDYKLQDFVIVSSFAYDDAEKLTSLSLSEGENYFHYFKRIQALPSLGNQDFNVMSNDWVHCPVCHRNSVFSNWCDAWENPNKYFEHEHICEACGGECSLLVGKDYNDNHHDVYKCDVCGMKWDD